jgi:hypothetical protein
MTERTHGPARSSRTWSYDEALATFPVVRDLTEAAVKQLEALAHELRTTDESHERRGELESSHREVVEQWTREVESLGCEVKGLWLVDWDSGDGYYCWKYPEPSLAHFHDYESGFAGRVPIN